MAPKQSENSYKIIVEGIVQGVGFRPFVYRQARKFGLGGTVRNVDGKVEILAVGNEEDVRAFIESLSISEDCPVNAQINAIRKISIPPFDATDFHIIESRFKNTLEINSEESLKSSSENGFEKKSSSLFLPDLPMCSNCEAEILDPNNRRHRHFFNTCTDCGPRFSILRGFPYDRANTSMDVFPMCEECAGEYHDPDSRRFHAETISCHNCGPVLLYKRGNHHGEEAFALALKDLDQHIVAIKGIGGYHLSCSPYREKTVAQLRILKNREKKPFALMFRDIDAIKKICQVGFAEENLLLSTARPIVLLKMKENPFAPSVLVGADRRCGCFLPYTPLQKLLLDEVHTTNVAEKNTHPACLVMTSANVSSSPIIRNEEEIFGLVDRVLYHGREILRLVEDSVAQVIGEEIALEESVNPLLDAVAPYNSPFIRKPFTQFLRRARGYAPRTIPLKSRSEQTILAFGGDLKAAFGFLTGNDFALSQYIGDLENPAVFEEYENAIQDFQNLFDRKPQVLVCDTHPGYFSTTLAKKMARQRNLPLFQVYHHHAHIASVMAEHGLSRVLGIAFDGNGYGEDGAVWGGEFLVCEEDKCERVGHLAYANVLGGDDAAVDAAKTAACYRLGTKLPTSYPHAELVKKALEQKINTYSTSSMGRLFDVVSSLLEICHKNEYEGQCATLLQYQAEAESKSDISPFYMEFDIEVENGVCIFGYKDILEKCGRGLPGAALGFHFAICSMIEEMCLWTRSIRGINQIALSGGVFQNAFLLDLTRSRLLSLGFDLFTNESVPCNDGGIALGQAFLGNYHILGVGYENKKQA